MGNYFISYYASFVNGELLHPILHPLCQWGTTFSYYASFVNGELLHPILHPLCQWGTTLSPLQVHFYTLVLICDQSSSTLIRVNEILGIVHSSLGVPLMKEIIVSSPLVCKYNEARSYILHYCPCISVSSFCIVAILIYQLYIIFFNGIPIMKRVIRTHL